jgi:ABC-type polar amino acid transport system ATPase subunit
MPPETEPTILTIRGLVKRFGDRTIINGLDLDVRRGEIVVFIGPSGTGKSTLLRCVNGLETRDGGDICFDGQTVGVRHAELRAVRRKIGMIFQNFNLYPHLTALQNVTLTPAKILGRPKDQVEAEAREIFRRVRLEHRIDAYPAQMSGGEQQRVAIARALAIQPKMLMFDEPTSALDPETVGEVLSVMAELAIEGSTMLVVTHEVNFAREVGTRLIFMDGGRIVEEGDPRAMLRAPREDRTKAFLSAIRRDA